MREADVGPQSADTTKLNFRFRSGQERVPPADESGVRERALRLGGIRTRSGEGAKVHAGGFFSRVPVGHTDASGSKSVTGHAGW
jgi:hypothetical protein